MHQYDKMRSSQCYLKSISSRFCERSCALICKLNLSLNHTITREMKFLGLLLKAGKEYLEYQYTCMLEEKGYNLCVLPIPTLMIPE